MPKPTFFNLNKEKRQRIIDAAVDEFSSQPYARATLDRIVAAAGISKGSMYQYFAGKSDLYRWLLTEYMGARKMEAIQAAPPAADATVWQTLEAAFLAGVHFATAEPQLTRLGARFLRDHELEPELDAISARNAAAATAWMTHLLQAGQARGELRKDLDIDVTVGFLTHALGEGMLDQLARRLGVSLADFLDHPQLTATLTDAQLLELVQSVTRLFRDGAGA